MLRVFDSSRQIMLESIRAMRAFTAQDIEEDGYCLPALYFHGLNGNGRFQLLNESDSLARARFVEIARLICIAEGADVAVTRSAGWVKPTANWNPFDLPNRPQVQDRREAVLITGETLSERTAMILPIVREHWYSRIGAAENVSQCNIQGQFAALLPATMPDTAVRDAARETLQRAGVVDRSQKWRRRSMVHNL